MTWGAVRCELGAIPGFVERYDCGSRGDAKIAERRYTGEKGAGDSTNFLGVFGGVATGKKEFAGPSRMRLKSC